MKKSTQYLLYAALCLIALSSMACLLDSKYPKTVTVAYSVTSSDDARSKITYTNETGGESKTDAVTLPWTKTIKMEVESYDFVGLSVSTPFLSSTPDDLILEIKVDGKSVERQVNENASSAYISHTFN